jgi:hypothetical protein
MSPNTLGVPRFLLAFGNSSTQVCETFKGLRHEKGWEALFNTTGIFIIQPLWETKISLSPFESFTQCIDIPYNSQNKQQQFPEQHWPTVICNCVYCEVRTQTLNIRYMKCVLQRVSTVGISNTFHNFPLCRISNTRKWRPESTIIPDSNKTALPVNV